MPGCTLLALAGGLWGHYGLADLASATFALAAFCGGLGSLLPAVSNFLDGRQKRRHAEALHRAELAASSPRT